MKGKTGKRLRRESAKKLLEAQLKRGTKYEKINGHTTTNMIQLTDRDHKRIQNEIENINKKNTVSSYN